MNPSTPDELAAQLRDTTVEKARQTINELAARVETGRIRNGGCWCRLVMEIQKILDFEAISCMLSPAFVAQRIERPSTFGTTGQRGGGQINKGLIRVRFPVLGCGDGGRGMNAFRGSYADCG